MDWIRLHVAVWHGFARGVDQQIYQNSIHKQRVARTTQVDIKSTPSNERYYLKTNLEGVSYFPLFSSALEVGLELALRT